MRGDVILKPSRLVLALPLAFMGWMHLDWHPLQVDDKAEGQPEKTLESQEALVIEPEEGLAIEPTLINPPQARISQETILDRPLFRPSRRPVPPPPPKPKPVVKKVTPKPVVKAVVRKVVKPVVPPKPKARPLSDFLLSGILIGEGHKKAMIHQKGQADLLILGEQDKMSGWTITQIQPGRVLLSAGKDAAGKETLGELVLVE